MEQTSHNGSTMSPHATGNHETENQSQTAHPTHTVKDLSKGKIWAFAVGQFGWALLSGIISNWLVYFYQPDQSAIKSGQTVFVPQGLVILGFMTVIGAITASARLLDAFVDPAVASLSDRSTAKAGRRFPFLKWAAAPLAAVTLLVFFSPVNKTSWINVIVLWILVFAYYVALSFYCTPYNALIAELGHSQGQQLSISTAISFTFIAGTAIAYAGPVIWTPLAGVMGRVPAIRLTFALFAVIAFVCMEVPVWTINERDYVDSKPTQETAMRSLGQTFADGQFRTFVLSDIVYWIAITSFQTGLPFFVTSLLKLPESDSTLLFVLMTACSVACYPLVNHLARVFSKKNLMLIGFAVFTLAYVFTAVIGFPGVPSLVQGVILAVVCAFPMAVFGILPQTVVADIAVASSVTTGQDRQGMFYAARTFTMKLGQSLAMLLFTALSTVAVATGGGYRLAAGVDAVLCLAGGIIFAFYNERKINGVLKSAKKA
jgi:Na+/melibiose symporter-like transporter